MKALSSIASKAQSLHLALPMAMLFFMELDDFVKSAKTWSGTVKVTCQLKRDLEWWTHVPTHHNIALTWKPIENAYIHCDSSGYEQGEVLNHRVGA